MEFLGSGLSSLMGWRYVTGTCLSGRVRKCYSFIEVCIESLSNYFSSNNWEKILDYNIISHMKLVSEEERFSDPAGSTKIYRCAISSCKMLSYFSKTKIHHKTVIIGSFVI